MSDIQPRANATTLPESLQAQSRRATFNDDTALAGWLGFVSIRNARTFRSYQAEAIRFRLFLLTVHGADPERSLDHVMRDATEIDVALYEAHLLGHLKNGQKLPPLRVPQHLLSRFGRKDQPFSVVEDESGIVTTRAKHLKPGSANQALSILHALYQYWMRPDPVSKVAYLAANPVKRVKSAVNRMQRQTNRNFPIEAIQAMIDALDMEQQRETHPLQLAFLARRRWVVSLLFGLWGRRSEMASLRMNDFQYDGKRWCVSVRRKGGTTQVLPVAPWVVQELMRYRESLGLAPFPASTETRPAIDRVRLRSDKPAAFQVATTEEELAPCLDSDTLYRDVTATTTLAAAALRAGHVLPDLDSLQREMCASRLDGVSPHWFRHSGASIAINSGAMSLENASKMLGHSTPTVTAEMYYHPDQDQIEKGMEDLGKQLQRSPRAVSQIAVAPCSKS